MFGSWGSVSLHDLLELSVLAVQTLKFQVPARSTLLLIYLCISISCQIIFPSCWQILFDALCKIITSSSCIAIHAAAIWLQSLSVTINLCIIQNHSSAGTKFIRQYREIRKDSENNTQELIKSFAVCMNIEPFSWWQVAEINPNLSHFMTCWTPNMSKC